MPYFKTSQEWLDQSILLIEARPSTTRVTTRYAIKPVKPRKARPASEPPADPSSQTQTETQAPAPAPAPAKPPRAALVLKTYDPASGVTLKYRTTKAAEVTRLVAAALGRLGRAMAGMQEVPEAEMADATTTTTAAAAEEGQQQQQQQQQGGGRKKKKGRK
ncbi:Uncharacterized protein ESCO_001117 [Escovopsis weberi]|uniref:SRP9 domain-containing protein n=1 Tax=Escovopsis weberi TaxID=150374 RepID=A0A0M8N3B0_ESCWE|nr:Uncharacterized protein ESCO_001117 [Escovopsis weberi]